MAIASGILGAAGIGMGLAGIGMGANAASMAKKKMTKLADWARLNPLDLEAITGESLSGMSKYFPTASELGSQFNTYYAGELEKLMETAYPGYAAQKQKFASTIGDYMAGVIPEDVTKGIMRAAAGRSILGGFSGSGLHRSLAARDLGTTSLGLQQYGLGMFGQVPSMFPHAMPMDVSQLSGFTPAQTASVRGRERDQYLQMKAQAIGMPGATSAWGQGLQELGGTLAGIGGMGMLSGGFGGYPTPKAPAMSYSQPYLNPSTWTDPYYRAQAERYYQ